MPQCAVLLLRSIYPHAAGWPHLQGGVIFRNLWPKFCQFCADHIEVIRRRTNEKGHPKAALKTVQIRQPQAGLSTRKVT